MNLWVIVASIFLCIMLAQVETRFFVEIAEPSVDIAELIEKMTTANDQERVRETVPEGGDERFTIVLYECAFVQTSTFKQRIVCKKIDEPEEEQKIYAVANFNGVSNLKLTNKWLVEMDGKYERGKFPQALTVGVEPHDYEAPLFKSTPADISLIKYNVYSILGRLVDFKERSNVWIWRQFFSINGATYFYGRDTEATMLLDHYVTILHELIYASGYNVELDSPECLSFKKSTATNICPRLKSWKATESHSGSQPHGGRLQKLFSRRRSQAQSKRSIPSWCASKLRSLSSSLSRSQTKFQTKPQTKSPSRFPVQSQPKHKQQSDSEMESTTVYPSSTKHKSQSDSDPEPEAPSPSRSPSKYKPRSDSDTESEILSSYGSPSPSRSQTLSDSEILKAAGLLSFKMFDPCYVQQEAKTSRKVAELYCTIYCQFLSATIHVYGQSAPECEHLKQGSCIDGMCVCSPCRGVTTGDVNMVYCNNKLRLRFYKQAARNTKPEDFQRQNSRF